MAEQRIFEPRSGIYDVHISPNEFVEVKLNEFGLKIINKKQFKTMNKVPNKENVYVMLMWELMAVFGPHFDSGNPMPFDGPMVFDKEQF